MYDYSQRSMTKEYQDNYDKVFKEEEMPKKKVKKKPKKGSKGY